MNRRSAALFVLLYAAAAARAFAPEVARYRAKIDLNRCERALIAASGLESGRKHQVARAVRDELESVAARLPFDVRPAYLLGTSALLVGEPAEAIEQLRRSLVIEERPETDLNLSRAHAAAGDAEAAAQDALRAIWLSPALSRELPKLAKGPVVAQVAALQRELESGSASAIPALAPSDSPPREHDR